MSDSDECRRSDRFTLLQSGTEAGASPTLANAQRHAEPGEQGGAAGEIPSGGTGLATMMPGADAVGVSAIKSVHFTQSCMKPWLCSQKKVRGEVIKPNGCFAAR